MEFFVSEDINRIFGLLTAELEEEFNDKPKREFRPEPRPVPPELIATGLPPGHAAFCDFEPISDAQTVTEPTEY